MLSYLLYRAVWANLIEGFNVLPNDPIISHLIFANNTIPFVKPEIGCILSSKYTLNAFEIISRLKIN